MKYLCTMANTKDLKAGNKFCKWGMPVKADIVIIERVNHYIDRPSIVTIEYMEVVSGDKFKDLDLEFLHKYPYLVIKDEQDTVRNNHTVSTDRDNDKKSINTELGNLYTYDTIKEESYYVHYEDCMGITEIAHIIRYIPDLNLVKYSTLTDSSSIQIMTLYEFKNVFEYELIKFMPDKITKVNINSLANKQQTRKKIPVKPEKIILNQTYDGYPITGEYYTSLETYKGLDTEVVQVISTNLGTSTIGYKICDKSQNELTGTISLEVFRKRYPYMCLVTSEKETKTNLFEKNN